MVKSSLTGPTFPAGRRRHHTMVWVISIRKACYTSAAALVLGVSPLFLALPAAARSLRASRPPPGEILPRPTDAGSAEVRPADRLTDAQPHCPGQRRPDTIRCHACPNRRPQAPSQTPFQGQSRPPQNPAPPTSDPVPTAGQDTAAAPATASAPAAVTTGTSAPPVPDAGQDPDPSAEQLPGAAAGQGDPGPDWLIGIAGSLLALGGLLHWAVRSDWLPPAGPAMKRPPNLHISLSHFTVAFQCVGSAAVRVTSCP